MYNPQDPCPVCLEVTGCDCLAPKVVIKKKTTKPKSLSNWFGDDEDYAVTETIRKKGRLGGRKVG
jgi:hypothetical protein